MELYVGVKVILHGVQLKSHSGHFTSGQNTQYPLDRKFSGHQSSYRCPEEKKFFLLPKIKHQLPSLQQIYLMAQEDIKGDYFYCPHLISHQFR
jgi:hypothetical protein